MLSDNKARSRVLRRLLQQALGGRAVVDETDHLDVAAGPPHRDLTVRRGSSEPPIVLVAVPAGTGYPQDVRRALAALDALGPRETPVLVAKRMSPGARTLLEQRGMSWADEDGNLRVAVGPMVVVVDVPATDVVAPERSFSWSGASGALAELVLRDLTSRGPEAPLDTVVALADRLGVSAPLVSRHLQRFDDEGWTRKSGTSRGVGAARHVIAPGELLSAWADWHVSRRRVETAAHTLLPDAVAWLQDLSSVWPHVRWLATGEAAAQVRAPFLSRVARAELYLEPTAYDDVLGELLDRAGLEPVPAGGRVRIVRADRYLFHLPSDTVEGVPVVNDIRLYGDLLTTGVRGVDAANELRDRRIGF